MLCVVLGHGGNGDGGSGGGHRRQPPRASQQALVDNRGSELLPWPPLPLVPVDARGNNSQEVAIDMPEINQLLTVR